jgi:hypothetical protein
MAVTTVDVQDDYAVYTTSTDDAGVSVLGGTASKTVNTPSAWAGVYSFNTPGGSEDSYTNLYEAQEYFGRFNLTSITGTVTAVRVRISTTIPNNNYYLRPTTWQTASALAFRSYSQLSSLTNYGAFGPTTANTGIYYNGNANLLAAVNSAKGGYLGFVIADQGMMTNSFGSLGNVGNSGNTASLRLQLEITTTTGGTDATLTTLVGDTGAAGGTSTFQVILNATLTTLVGDTGAAGGTTTFTAVTDATFTTGAADVNLTGGLTTFTAQSTGQFVTLPTDTSAVGGSSTFTGQKFATFTTAVGDLTVDGATTTFGNSSDTLRTSRVNLAAALQGTTWTVYEEPPAALQTPAVIIQPADPYLELITINQMTWRITYELTYAVNYQDNKAALNQLEILILDVIRLMPDDVQIGPISAPSPVDVAGANLLTAQQIITINRTDS